VKTVRCTEHQLLKVGDATDCDLTFAQVEALQKTLPSNLRALQWTSRNTVKTTEQVGMVAAAGIRLEILPKVGAMDRDHTRAVLVRMIAASLDIPVHDGEVTGHSCQRRDLLEVLIGLFAHRLQIQLRAGLSRNYQQHTNDLNRLRGKLDVIRQFTNLATSPQKLACRYNELGADTSLNRLLLCALVFLRRRSLLADTQRLITELIAHFEDVRSATPHEVLNESVVLSRSEQRWSVLQELARLLLTATYQTVHGGERDGISLLFDMNLLFEKYVASLSRRISAESGYQLQSQGPRRYLATDHQQRSVFHTKPDLHLHKGEHVIVLDTKWKELDQTQSNLGVSQGDAYQMLGYAETYAAREVILVYPQPMNTGAPGFQKSWLLGKGQIPFKVLTIDLSDTSSFQRHLHLLLDEGVLTSPNNLAANSAEQT
jgi:5-methylcytosine-specific restriction enzyme subunit McrC